MSYEAEQESQEGADGSEGVENADDLTMALAGGETTFVSETKQPMSKGTMVVAGLLIACGAVTYFMYVRTGPAEASANPGSVQNEKVVKEFMDDPTRQKSWTELLTKTDGVVREFKREIHQVPLVALASNPFEKEKPKPDEDVEATRRKQEIEKMKAAAKEAVADLKLQTIFHRDARKATVMISNRVYRKGEKIQSGEGKITFTVDDIRPDAVTISTPVAGEEPLKFELSMKR